MDLTPEETQRWNRVGMLAALAITLGYLETFVPIPIPGVKLGLANISVLIALGQHDTRGAFGIAVIKVLASGLLFGSPVMMAYSATGTLLAFAIMAPLAPLPTMHLVMVSIVGALAHEIGQLVVAMLLLGTPLVWYSAPLLEVAGCVTGALCGIVATRTLALLKGGESLAGPQAACSGKVATPQVAQLPQRGRAAGARSLDARAVLVGFVVFAVLVLRASSAPVLTCALVLSVGACATAHVRPRDVVRALRPLAFVLLVTFVAQLLNARQGIVVGAIGPVVITREAIEATCVMMARLVALCAASIAAMRLASLEALVDAIDWLLAPMRHLGFCTEGFVLALRTSLQFVPMLGATIADNAPLLRSKLLSRELWTMVFPQMIARLYLSANA